MPKEGNELGGDGLALASKIFQKRKSDWPRISLAVYQDKKMDRLMIKCEERTKKGWWRPTNLPVELIPDYIRVIREAEKKYHAKKR